MNKALAALKVGLGEKPKLFKYSNLTVMQTDFGQFAVLFAYSL